MPTSSNNSACAIGGCGAFSGNDNNIHSDAGTSSDGSVCQTLATAAGLPGTWTSWLSSGNSSPTSHMGSGPWYRIEPSPQTLVTTLNELENGPCISAPVLNTQRGVDVSDAFPDGVGETKFSPPG